MVRVTWKVSELTNAMKQMQDNKFDCIIALCGRRGIGKSTLGVKLAKQFNEFRIKKDVAFSREDVTQQLAKKIKGVILGDEIINVMHNREFFNQEQIKLIKMLNMYRDSCNIFIVCVPSFRDLDKQFRNLCKIRIDVIRRGIGIVHFPMNTQFGSDSWDMERNQKIEEMWSLNKKYKPKYHLLTTYRGIVMFGDISEKSRELYERVKQEKRNVLVKSEMDVSSEKTKTDKLYETLLLKLSDKSLDKRYLNDLSNILGIKYNNLIRGLNLKMKEKGLDTSVTKELQKIRNEKNREVIKARKLTAKMEKQRHRNPLFIER